MNFFPQPCVAPSESARLGAKQGHAKSATFAKDFFDHKNNPFRLYPDSVGALRPFRESIPTPHAKSAKAATHTSKLHSHFRTLRSSARFTETEQSRAAFSLTEVVIAMGVAAVAFTSIIALFPLGLNMSKESYEATQAAVIAQSIMADLSDQASANSAKLIQKTGTNLMSSANYETIQMMGAGAPTNPYIYLAYDQQIRTDSSNNPVMLRPCAFSVSLNGPNEPTWFQTNAPAGAIFLVKVSLNSTFRLSAGGITNPKRVDVTIESPASAPATNRIQYVFSGVIHQN